jgi:hypothetical protein
MQAVQTDLLAWNKRRPRVVNWASGSRPETWWLREPDPPPPGEKEMWRNSKPGFTDSAPKNPVCAHEKKCRGEMKK